MKTYSLLTTFLSSLLWERSHRKTVPSRTVIDIMKQIFSEYGVPRVVRSDNGPHFDVQAFKDFAMQFDFHTTSSPHYARSNGFIEAQVKTVKKTLLKAKATKTDLNIALLSLRATPIDNRLLSPGELLLSRAIQDDMPRKIQRVNSNEELIGRLLKRQEQQRLYHKRGRKALPTLLPANILPLSC